MGGLQLTTSQPVRHPSMKEEMYKTKRGPSLLVKKPLRNTARGIKPTLAAIDFIFTLHRGGLIHYLVFISYFENMTLHIASLYSIVSAIVEVGDKCRDAGNGKVCHLD